MLAILLVVSSYIPRISWGGDRQQVRMAACWSCRHHIECGYLHGGGNSTDCGYTEKITSASFTPSREPESNAYPVCHAIVGFESDIAAQFLQQVVGFHTKLVLNLIGSRAAGDHVTDCG